MSVVGLEAYLENEEKEAREAFRGGSPVRKLMKCVRRYPHLLVGGLAMVMLGTFATLMEPRLFGYAIDDAIIPGKWDRLVELAVYFLLVICVRVVSMIVQGYLFEVMGQRVTQDLRVRLFTHLQQLPMSTHDKTSSGRLLTRMTNDIASLAEMFSSGFVLVISNSLLVLGILSWLIVLDPKLGLITASVFPLLIVASAYFSKKLKVAYREARNKLSALNTFLAENLLGMRIVHLFNRQRIHLERFDRINQWYTDAQMSSVKVFAFFQPTITLCSGVSLALLIWFGGSMAWSGEIKLGVLVAYFSYALSLFQPVREIADKWNVFVSAMASAERIFSILDWPIDTYRTPIHVRATPVQGVRGKITFENVWFAYEKENWILKDLSFELQAGMKVGVVGHTGAGKSTLISLLLRLYEPQKGRILLDGKDLKEFDARSLRAAIGIVQQDVFLFSGTIRDNITFWSESPDADQNMLNLNLNPDAELNERGSNLSLGQRQLLSFSRAAAARPQVWILDEATANMDFRSEEILEDTLKSAAKEKTMIMIAHRLSTVRAADQILVLHKGSLLEKGTHLELVERDGLYRRLYRYQQAQTQSAPSQVV